jgi:hypothetical protein
VNVNGGEGNIVYCLLVGKPEGKIPLRTPRHKCADNIKMDYGEIGWRGLNGFVWLRIRTSGELL